MTNLNELQNITQQFSNTEKMPVLFLGHGSPMNAIEENEFVEGFRHLAKTLPRPNAMTLYFGTLVHERNKGHCHANAANYTRFWMFSPSIIRCAISSKR
jgi:aromatic ring-opening dioxygenase catalytic subunit (LigB family)